MCFGGSGKAQRLMYMAQEAKRAQDNAALQAQIDQALAKGAGADNPDVEEAARQEEECLRRLKGRGATILTGGLGDTNFGKNVSRATLLGAAA
jgi:hypothetical protein